MPNNKEILICPNCGEKVSFNIDGYGYTPIHLHCNKDDINIGATSFDKCAELFTEYHAPRTYLEFYNNEIKFLAINRKVIINNE